MAESTAVRPSLTATPLTIPTPAQPSSTRVSVPTWQPMFTPSPTIPAEIPLTTLKNDLPERSLKLTGSPPGVGDQVALLAGGVLLGEAALEGVVVAVAELVEAAVVVAVAAGVAVGIRVGLVRSPVAVPVMVRVAP